MKKWRRVKRCELILNKILMSSIRICKRKRKSFMLLRRNCMKLFKSWRKQNKNCRRPRTTLGKQNKNCRYCRKLIRNSMKSMAKLRIRFRNWCMMLSSWWRGRSIFVLAIRWTRSIDNWLIISTNTQSVTASKFYSSVSLKASINLDRSVFM